MKRKIFFALICHASLSVDLFAEKVLKINSLENALKHAMNRNESLLVSRQLASVNQEFCKKDVGSFFPKLNFSYNDSASISFNSSDYRNKSFGMGLSFLLYDGGERKMEHELKIFDSLYSRLQAEDYVENHCLQLMEVYYEYQKEIRRKEILMQTLQSARQWNATLEKEYELGMILETDCLEYEVKCLELETSIAQQDEKIFQILFQMKNLLGLNSDESLTVDFDDSVLKKCRKDFLNLDYVFGQALLNSKVYKKMLVEARYSEKKRKIEKSYFLPNVSLEPEVSFQGEDFPLRGPKYQMMISFSFEKNPFFSFQGSQSFSAEKKVLTSSTSYEKGISKNDFAWKESEKLKKLNVHNQVLDISAFKENLKMEIRSMILQHEQLLESVQILEKEIEINEKLILVLKKEIEKGMKEPLTLLEQKIKLAEKKSSLYENHVRAAVLEKKLVFISSPKTGGIENAFKK